MTSPVFHLLVPTFAPVSLKLPVYTQREVTGTTAPDLSPIFIQTIHQNNSKKSASRIQFGVRCNFTTSHDRISTHHRLNTLIYAHRNDLDDDEGSLGIYSLFIILVPSSSEPTPSRGLGGFLLFSSFSIRGVTWTMSGTYFLVFVDCVFSFSSFSFLSGREHF